MFHFLTGNLTLCFSCISSPGDCITQLTSSCDFSGYAKSCDRHRMLSVYVSTCSCMIGFNNLFNNTCTGIKLNEEFGELFMSTSLENWGEVGLSPPPPTHTHIWSIY